jgi:hypothetical protein
MFKAIENEKYRDIDVLFINLLTSVAKCVNKSQRTLTKTMHSHKIEKVATVPAHIDIRIY